MSTKYRMEARRPEVPDFLLTLRMDSWDASLDAEHERAIGAMATGLQHAGYTTEVTVETTTARPL